MEIEVGMFIKTDYIGDYIDCITNGKEYLIKKKTLGVDGACVIFKDDNGDDYELGIASKYRISEDISISEFELEEWEVVSKGTPKKEVVDTAKYQVININGKPTRLPTGDETNLNQEDIFDLIDIALDNRDEEYFNELVKRLNKV